MGFDSEHDKAEVGKMDLKYLYKIRDISVLVYGDMMVDKYIQGEVTRISPEAPVPVLAVRNKQNKLGGAGNVINNIISLGAKSRVIGYLGNDENGTWLINEFRNRGVDVSYVKQYDDVRTISKTRLVAKNQQFLRYDEEEIKPVPDQYLHFVARNVQEIFRNIQVVVISDYAKGAVTESIAQLIIKYANANQIPVIVDPKGKDYSKYADATICAPNTHELGVVMGKDISSENDIELYGQKLCEDIGFKYLVLTRSEKGMSLFQQGGNVKEDFPADVKDVIDVTGAGDTVVATIALLFAIHLRIEDCCVFANKAASAVCSKFGTATLSLNELFERILISGKCKLVDLETAQCISENLKEKGKTIVFTNGCFDLLHAGHLSSFLQAKAFGDVLFVAVNSDQSVKRIKGDSRPVIREKYRVDLLCALECIDYVILMEDTNPVNIIKAIKPDISVKGIDWEGKYIPEKEVIESYGGSIKFIDLEKGLSTTEIINKIRRG